MFRSRRRGTISARIHIPSGSCALVQKENFWPKFVGCKSWRSKEYDSKTAEAASKCYPGWDLFNLCIMVFLETGNPHYARLD